MLVIVVANHVYPNGVHLGLTRAIKEKTREKKTTQRGKGHDGGNVDTIALLGSHKSDLGILITNVTKHVYSNAYM